MTDYESQMTALAKKPGVSDIIHGRDRMYPSGRKGKSEGRNGGMSIKLARQNLYIEGQNPMKEEKAGCGLTRIDFTNSLK
jgi:hypothetical protein